MSAGTAFGKYFLLKKIAAGGMGEIFLAKLKGPVGFEKLLVIKRILQHHVENEEFLDMFFAEARVAAQLTHSNVVQIYEMGEIDDSYFIAMEYVHGKSLRDLIDRARQLGEYIHPGHAIEIIAELCAGLSYAHNARDMSGESLGIVHRDINPHNMLISYGGQLKVIDFGIAKSEMSMHHTETGTIKGKFVYMSPEQSAAEQLDKRSDIFAVGICLYETLTFVNPFAKPNVVLSLDAIQRKDPPPVSEISPKLAPFDDIIRKALAKKPHDRYGDCLELRDDLLNLLSSGAVPQPPQSVAEMMHDLFEEQIEQEKRMIVETDSANTTQIEAMRRARVEDAAGRSGKHRTYHGRIVDDLELAAHAAEVELIEEAHSRRPFLFAMATIAGLTMLFTTALVKFGPHPGANDALAMQPTRGGEPPVGDEVSEEIASDDGSDVDAGKAPSPASSATKSGRLKSDSKHKSRTKSDAEAERRERLAKQKLDEQSAREKPVEKKEPPRDAARDPAPTSPRPTKTESSFGVISVSSNPPARITHQGRAGQTFKLKGSTGAILVGSSEESDKFQVKITFRVTGGNIVYTTVDSTPWAIVRGKGGIGLGKTPLANVKGETTTTFELLNPKENLRHRITVRYSP